ncbi:MAG: CAP domain-containing protein [Clostridium sp.]|nr:CAP domain-containing protein [Clostridium sp.]MCM1398549.1 CAP domain-containing protein [Clostridium sp.]MCM1459837.1 CAP domain-containing protein [Bacteroides sp.]
MNKLIPLFIIPCTFLLYLLNIREGIFAGYAFMNQKTEIRGEQAAATTGTPHGGDTHATDEYTQSSGTETVTGASYNTHTETATEESHDTDTETTKEEPHDTGTKATTEAQDTFDAPLTEAGSCDLCVSCPGSLIEQVNSYREANGFSSLSHSSELDNAAAIRCRELVTNMSHTRPDARSCSTVFTDLGISASVWGENLAAGYDSSAEVAADWMASSTHMANILNPSFTRCGVAYLSCDTGYGSYWVILFAD